MHNLQLAPLMEQLTIKKKNLNVDNLDLSEPFAWAQKRLIQEIERQYNLGLPVRIIVLKARQLGISTATEGVIFNWSFIHPGTNALVIAHETEASQYLFEMTQLMWDAWPWKHLYKAKHLSQKRLSWEQTRSTIRIATARNVQSGRGRTLHAVHCSECAFWEEPETLMLGLNQTIPEKHGTIVILESTANGVGNWFHSEWMAAVRRESSYVPLFFPWFENPEYSVIHPTLSREQLIDDEKTLLALHPKMTLSNLEWRRNARMTKVSNPEEFAQEYPSNPHEAFLAKGRNVFPLRKLADNYIPKPYKKGYLQDVDGKLSFFSDPTGPLSIFKNPGSLRSHAKYIVAGDPTYTTQGDWACIQVLNRRTFEQVAVWHGKLDPISFANELVKLSYYYNTALLTTEITGPGYGTIGRIVEMGYPNVWRHKWADKAQGKVSQSLGWLNSYNRKNWAVSRVTYLLSQDSLTIHDEKTYQQMETYTVLDNGAMGPANRDDFDDAVMALCIGVVCSITDQSNSMDEEYDLPDIPRDDFIPPWEAWGADEEI